MLQWVTGCAQMMYSFGVNLIPCLRVASDARPHTKSYLGSIDNPNNSCIMQTKGAIPLIHAIALKNIRLILYQFWSLHRVQDTPKNIGRNLSFYRLFIGLFTFVWGFTKHLTEPIILLPSNIYCTIGISCCRECSSSYGYVIIKCNMSIPAISDICNICCGNIRTSYCYNFTSSRKSTIIFY